MATTPVVMKVQDYKDREVQMVSYEFDQVSPVAVRSVFALRL